MTEDRIRQEQAFHDERFGGGGETRERAWKFYSINRRMNEYYVDLVSRHCRGKRLLEYGCGTGGNSAVWVDLGADVTGIDISAAGIEKAKERAAGDGFDARYHVMDAERTEFDDDSFDVVVGRGVLHHLKIDRSCAEIARIIKRSGHAIFVEPLGHNPLINLYRRRTQSMRTEHEHPLKIGDFAAAERYFSRVDVAYFNLFTLPAVALRNTILFKPVLGILESIDRLVMFCFPFLRRFAWTAVIHMSRPNKDRPAA
jgi:SAM-dependent methyltransferase